MTDADREPDVRAVLLSLRPGTAVIFRHYGDPGRAALGRDLRALARQRRLPFLVAGDRRLACGLRADGLHLPARMVGRFAAQAFPGLVTAAAHDAREARRAARAGADIVLLSPVFPTASHPDRPALGPLRLAAVVRALSVPVLALGGVSTANVRRVWRAGAAGVAGIGAIARLGCDPFGLRRRGRCRKRSLARRQQMV